MRILGLIFLLFYLSAPAAAHNVDQYLQSTQLAIHPDHIDATMQLIPGDGVVDRILPTIDTDGDRRLTQAEGEAYARRVLGDLTLSADGAALTPDLVSVTVPSFADMEDGLAGMSLIYKAALPQGRSIFFANHHQPDLSVYVVTTTLPEGFEILSQERDALQVSLRLVYQPGHAVDFGNFAAMFHLGLSHIAEGTDHLLFLLALLLPAPLVAAVRRWGPGASARRSLVQIVTIVSAFTLGHSLTLALAALGIVRVPSAPIEVLIAVSILISAVHALRPIFPGKEAGVAAFFGLIHGLAFANTIQLMHLTAGQRVAGLLGFNLGIEAMQLLVVAAVMPSLYLFSRTRVYGYVRIAGGVFAGAAACGWIAERLLGVANMIEVPVQSVAGHALPAALIFFAASIVTSTWERRSR
ncbi:MAG: HupE/UreJ family protein [Rhodospirillaceae bacterium]